MAENRPFLKQGARESPEMLGVRDLFHRAMKKPAGEAPTGHV
jgi:hypothetical protein